MLRLEENTTEQLQVLITGEVNTFSDDTYILTYSAEDSSGNVGQIQRLVTVLPRDGSLLFSLPTEQDVEPHTTELLIPVTVAGYELVGGFQFGVEWDPEVLSLTGIVLPETPALTELNENNFDTSTADVGLVQIQFGSSCIRLHDEDPDPSNGEDPTQQEPVQMPEAAVALLPDSIVWDGVNEEIAVPLRVKNFDGISGVQFTLEWDASALDLVTEVNNTLGTTEVKVTDSQGVSHVTIPGVN